ncbi:MAG: hypothetical protein ACI9XP_001645 [Lentimonas sp.]|jgi:hypothetical protein
MKYRMLTEEERKIFDEDFKHFLITNGVSNEEWIALNESKDEKALLLVELFSDTVLDKVYSKIRFIEFRSKDSCLVFHCNDDEMELISIVPQPKADVDLSTPESIHEALVSKAHLLKIFKTKKPYSTLRELEIHQMTQQGCVASSKEFWDALQSLID